MSAVAAVVGPVERPKVPSSWDEIDAAVPQLAATMLAYLAQVTVSFRPSTVSSTATDLRIFAGFLIGHDPALSCVADIDRSHVEAFKIWQHDQPGMTGKPFKTTSFRRRIGSLRMFFIRLIEWDWDDAPARVPIFFGDVPERDESLPKFLDDGDYAKFMRALAEEPALHRRLGVDMLARTGMRVGELCNLEADAGPFTPGRLLSGAEGPLNRYAVDRWVKIVAKRAGITSNVHPHRLRHTFATQAINRGMTIDVIAALLKHRSLDMTRRYAQISNRVVAKVEALYSTDSENGRVDHRHIYPSRTLRNPDDPRRRRLLEAVDLTECAGYRSPECSFGCAITERVG